MTMTYSCVREEGCWLGGERTYQIPDRILPQHSWEHDTQEYVMVKSALDYHVPVLGCRV